MKELTIIMVIGENKVIYMNIMKMEKYILKENIQMEQKQEIIMMKKEILSMRKMRKMKKLKKI